MAQFLILVEGTEPRALRIGSSALSLMYNYIMNFSVLHKWRAEAGYDRAHL